MLRSEDMTVIEFRPSTPEKAPEAPAVRGGIRGLLSRLGITIADGDGGDETVPPEAPALATSFENRVRRLRANAHAAYHSVEGGGDAALDRALSVVEAEWLAARAERESYAGALKAIRMYAADPHVRGLARRALARPSAVACADAALHISGRDRFPFLDEFDA